MKLQKAILYGCLFLISIVYIFSLNFVRPDGLYFYLLLIINFVFVINYLSYSIQDMKGYIYQLLTVIILMAIPFSFHGVVFGSYPFAVNALYLFDLGMIFGRLIGESIHIDNHIKKSLFIAFPIIVLFIIPLFYMKSEDIIMTSEGIVRHFSVEPPTTLFFIFLLSLYACSIVFLSDRHSKINLILSILYILVIIVLVYVNVSTQFSLFPPQINIEMQLMNSLILLIAYSIMSLYGRHKLKSNPSN